MSPSAAAAAVPSATAMRTIALRRFWRKKESRRIRRNTRFSFPIGSPSVRRRGSRLAAFRETEGGRFRREVLDGDDQLLALVAVGERYRVASPEGPDRRRIDVGGAGQAYEASLRLHVAVGAADL